MTADGIRETFTVANGWAGSDLLLAEIAAQLAELNTHARKLAAVVQLDWLTGEANPDSGHLKTDYYASTP